MTCLAVVMPAISAVMRTTKPKIFIVGLPRTGTTSLCLTLLNAGFTVAHTAYTQTCFERAQVIADTPVFNDYQLLDSYYPNSKFINLTRDLSLWLPSIQRLLLRMYNNVTRSDGGFNPYIKRCYQQTFSPFSLKNIHNTEFLADCYYQHQQDLHDHFANRAEHLLSIDISTPNSFSQLMSFIELTAVDNSRCAFEHLNKAGKITAWNSIRHPLKINSTKDGRIAQLDYLNHSPIDKSHF